MRAYLGYSFETIGNATATGCVLAGLRESLWHWWPYRALVASPWFVVVPCALLLAASLQGWGFANHVGHHRVLVLISNVIGITVMNVAIGVCVDRYTRFPALPVGRVPNSRPLVQLSAMGYSVYLRQELVVNRAASSPLAWFPMSLLLALGLAAVSYYVVEQPIQRARTRRAGLGLANT